MKTPELVPLPLLVPERDGVRISAMEFPQGFDEERILINAGRIKQISRMAGLDGVTVIGTSGQKSDHAIGIGSMGADGSATFGANLSVHKRKRDYVNGVRLHATQTSASDEQSVPHDYYYAPVTIQANITARDEQLREESKLMDTAGHAQFIDQTISQGLSIAANQRLMLNVLNCALFINVMGTGAGVSVITHNPLYLGAFASFWYGSNIAAAMYGSYKHDLPMHDKQFSLVAGIDRALIARIMTKTTALATVAK